MPVKPGIKRVVIATGAGRGLGRAYALDLAARLRPEHVAPIIALLVSEQCRVTGQTIVAGGGGFRAAAKPFPDAQVGFSDFMQRLEEASHADH